MLESIILGMVQGVTEWLPISSEGAIVVLKMNLFNSDLGLGSLIKYALFLHLGTFLAALIYLRKEVFLLVKNFFNYRKVERRDRNLIKFYFLATFFSGFFAFIIFKIVGFFEERVDPTSKAIILIVGIALLFTAFLQIRKKGSSFRGVADLNFTDSFLLGLAQGFSIIPGLSRSGLTISAFLLRKIDKKQALKLSFLMSLPVVLAGNILLNLEMFALSLESLLGFCFSFVFGILTIHILLKLADRVNFGIFVLFFSLLTIISVFV